MIDCTKLLECLPAEFKDLDVFTIQNITNGTIERVNVAVAEGHELTPELCHAALVNYLEWSIQYTQKVLTNENGECDKLTNMVIDLLYQNKN
ncbi:hypothetical protein [Vibrio sp. D431a]|uniref:hypothetical protein n=1 Tax=Vibrio sp. D431a TaxID=2837388 RepID=UPI0025568675|nr:hypothetical protein [Vibrio sp. D431a]MDK9793329.1 hypothetical protein [Vibrio sp. D431a]